ncbi:MAG: peptidyl-prolyl cis-trans isomerase [Desulfarculus sp.]|nr:peptidyl-prolyl cis-trans isomerase [Desulfarculus sp.]
MVTNYFVMLQESSMMHRLRPLAHALAWGLVLLAMAWVAACSKPSAPSEVANVDGQAILLDDFLAQTAFMGLGKDPQALSPDLRQAVLETLARRRLVLMQAQAKGIRLEREELDREEASLRRGLSEEAFELTLIAQGIDYDEWRQVLSQEILTQKTLDLLLAGQVQVTPDEIRTYYQEHAQEFSRPEQVLAQHALVPDKETARKLLQRLTQGEDMAAAAAELGVTLPEEGEPTWLSRGHMPETLEEKVFALEPGKLAGPLSSPYGLHVVRVLARRPASKLDLAQAADEIQRRLAAEKKEQMAALFIDQMRAKAKVTFNAEFAASGKFGTPGS